MPDAFGGGRKQSKPPERGVFPLDHNSECRIQIDAFLKCLKDNNQDHFPCKAFSKSYLQCRMDNELMERSDLNKLGLAEGGQYIRDTSESQKRREAEGFVAGTGVLPGRFLKTGGKGRSA